MLWFPSSGTELSPPDATGHFLHTDLCRTSFIFCTVKSVANYILCFSICLHACCFYYPGLASPGKAGCPSPLKHEAYAKSWLCRKAFGLQISSPITQNYQAVLQPSWALVWPRTAHLSSAGNAGSEPISKDLPFFSWV